MVETPFMYIEIALCDITCLVVGTVSRNKLGVLNQGLCRLTLLVIDITTAGVLR